jgi:hypothetical protein
MNTLRMQNQSTTRMIRGSPCSTTPKSWVYSAPSQAANRVDRLRVGGLEDIYLFISVSNNNDNNNNAPRLERRAHFRVPRLHAPGQLPARAAAQRPPPARVHAEGGRDAGAGAADAGLL